MLNKKKSTVFVEKEITDATMVADDLRSGKIGYNNDGKVTGTLIEKQYSDFVNDADLLPEEAPLGKIFYNNEGRQVGGGIISKSLILPDNIDDLSLSAETDSINMYWTIPESEVPIDHFNLYALQTDISPTSISEMEMKTTVQPTETNYKLQGLESGLMYHINITSVTEDGYENASIRGMKNATATKGYWLLGLNYMSGGSEERIYYSDDGETWNELLDDEGQTINVNGGWDGLLVAEKRVFLGDSINRNLKELNLQTKKVETISGVDSIYKYPRPALWDDGRFFMSATYSSGGYSVMWYHNGIPKGWTGWIAIDRSSGNMIGNHKGGLFSARYIEQWNVYDFNSNPKWITYGRSGLRDCMSVAYGDGKYVLVGEYNMSVYILEENIRKSGSYVIITGVNSDQPDWIKVIYSEKAGKFFAVREDGYTFYSIDLKSWIPMNGHLSDGSTQYSVNLVYGNGRLIFTHAEGKFSFYCVDGINWIAMSGLIYNPYGNYTDLISLYD